MQRIGYIGLLFAVLACRARGDWAPGDPASMRPQLPDVSTTGVAVCMVDPLAVADDWLCTGGAMIANIHLWAAWSNNTPARPSFDVAIWSDDPGAGAPGARLWHRLFLPGAYGRQQTRDPGAAWWNPDDGTYVWPGDPKLWAYDFVIPAADAFVARTGMVYWLSVEVLGLVPSILEEGFEKWPPTGWTIRNDGAPQNCPWASGLSQSLPDPNNTGGSGDYADADSLACGGTWPMDTSLVSPAVDLRGASRPVLEFKSDMYWYDLGSNEVFDVDASVDGGATWTNLLHREGQDYRGPETISLPLTAVAASSNACVRFHYWNADWENWWQVDEVRVYDLDAPSEKNLGWRTATNAAVRPSVFRSSTNAWQSLAYPGWHPAAGTNIALAFAVAGVDPTPGMLCEAPLSIALPAALPYAASDTTCGRRNDYTNTCMGVFASGEDLVVELVVTQRVIVDIALSADTPWAGMALQDACPPAGDCVYVAASGANPDVLEAVNLRPGTYYLMVDTYAPPDCAAFTLSIVSCPHVARALTNCAAWRQEPDLGYGVNLPSAVATNAGGTVAAWLLADDWLPDGRRVTGLRWWGSYAGWPDAAPPSTPSAGRPTGFRVTAYADGGGVPGAVCTNWFATLAAFGATNPPGAVFERPAGAVPAKIGAAGPEWQFEYTLALPAPLTARARVPAWLGIAAAYDADVAVPLAGVPVWSWLTAPDTAAGGGTALWVTNPPAWRPLGYPQYPCPHAPALAGLTPWLDAGASDKRVNAAFELVTDVCPARCLEWEREPEASNGLGCAAWAQPPDTGTRRADDFRADGRRVTGLRWWGSCAGWRTNEWYAAGAAPPRPWPLPDRFRIWLRDDVFDGTNARPATAVAAVEVPATNCGPVFAASADRAWAGGGGTNAAQVFGYAVDLLDPAVAGAGWPVATNGWYWIDLQAVYDAPPAYPWQWEIARAGETSTAAAVVSSDGGQTWSPDPLPVGHPRAGAYHDLAFTVLVTNLPSTNSPWFRDVALTGAQAGPGTAWIWSTGYCGCGWQVLQASTNLKTGAWRGAATNTAPRPTVTWVAASSNGPARFYRVVQGE